MATLGSILVTLDANITGLNRGLTQAGAAISRFGAQTRQSLAEIDRAFMSLGKMAAGAGAALGGALLFAANKAAEAERNLSVLQVVAAKNSVDFGALSKALDEVAGQFGLTGGQAQIAAATLIRSGATLEQTAALLQAAGASALLTGFDIQQAWTNVATAVVTGRSELLETSGIITNLGPAQQAYARSLGKTVEELTLQERIQAGIVPILAETRSEVELIGTATAGYSGQVARLQANLDELVISLGQQVLPALTDVVIRLNELVTTMRGLPTETKAAAVSVAEVGAAAGLLAGGLVAARSVVGVFGGAVAALGKGLLTLVRNPLTAVIAALVQFGRGFIEASSVTIPWLDIMARVGDVVIGTGQAVLGLTQTLGVLLQAIGMLVGTGFTALVESIQALPQGLGVIETWAAAMAGIFSSLMGGISQFGTAFKQVMTGDIIAAGQAAQAGVRQMGALINGGLAAITEPAKQATMQFADTAITTPWSQAFNSLNLNGLNGALNAAGAQLETGGARIRLAFDTSVASPLTTSATNLVTTTKAKLMELRAAFAPIEEGAVPAAASLGTMGQAAEGLNTSLAGTPPVAGAAANAIADTGGAAASSASELERLNSAIAGMGQNLPSGLSQLGNGLKDIGAGSSKTASAVGGLADKAKTGTNALDSFDRQISEVGRSLASGLINPEEADGMVSKLRAMQEEAGGIKKKEDETNKALGEQKDLRDDQTEAAGGLADGQEKTQQLQSDINGAVAEQGELYGEVAAAAGEQTKELSEGERYLQGQLKKVEEMRAAEKARAAAERARAAEARRADQAAMGGGGGGGGGRRPEPQTAPRPTIVAEEYGVELQAGIDSAAKSGLTAGLTAASKGQDWRVVLKDALAQGVMDGVITGFTEALTTTGMFKDLQDMLSNSLTNALQEPLDRINGEAQTYGTNQFGPVTSLGIGGAPGIEAMPLQGMSTPETISKFFDQFMKGAEKAVDALKPIFEQLGTFLGEDMRTKVTEQVGSGLGAAVSSAMSAALSGGDWREELRKGMYNAVLQGLATSLTEQLLTRYEGLLDRIAGGITRGTSSAMRRVFRETDRLIAQLTQDLGGIMDEIAAQGATMRVYFENYATDGLTQGMTDFLEGEAGWKESLRESIRTATLNGLLDAIITEGIIENMFQPILNGIIAAIRDGNIAGAAVGVQEIIAQMPEVEATLSEVLGPLFGAFAPEAWGLPSPEDAQAQTPTTTAPLDLAGIQYQDPAIASQTGMEDSTQDFTDAVGEFQNAVNSIAPAVAEAAVSGSTPPPVAQMPAQIGGGVGKPQQGFVPPGGGATGSGFGPAGSPYDPNNPIGGFYNSGLFGGSYGPGAPMVPAQAQEAEAFADAVAEFRRGVKELKATPTAQAAPTIPNRGLI